MTVLRILAVALAGVASLRAGTIMIVDLPATGTDDAAGISPTNFWLCALGFGGSIESLFVNKVSFQRVELFGKGAGANYNHPFISGSDFNSHFLWSLSGSYSGAMGFATSTSRHVDADGELGRLLNGYSYLYGGTEAGDSITFDCSGFAPGKEYSLCYYYRQWTRPGGGAAQRPIDFIFNGEGEEEPCPANPVDTDAGGAHYIRYDFKAATNRVTMRLLARQAGNGPHVYAITLHANSGEGELSTITGERGFYSATLSESTLHPQYHVGSWIWAAQVRDRQTCRLWRAFEIPAENPAKQATLRITADNSYRLFLDGHLIGAGAEWRELSEYDLTPQLSPGRHVLAVEAFNDSAAAGMVAGLKIQLVSGQRLEVASDANWWIAPESDTKWFKRTHEHPHWSPARFVAPFGGAPWQRPPAIIRNIASPQFAALHFWQTGWFQFSLLALCVAVGLVCLRLLARVAIQTQAQQYLQRERARIARDIHDDLGARLTQLVLAGERAQNSFPGGAKTREQFNAIADNAREILGAVDEIVWVVNSRRDTIKDFEMYTCTYAEKLLHSAGIRCRIEVSDEALSTPLDLTIRRNLFLAIKEVLNNAARHSGANEVTLQIETRDGSVRVLLADNGKGFDPSSADGTRNGLFNMTQRLAELGGSCTITTAPGAGCRIQLIAPVKLSKLPRARWWQLLWRRPAKTSPENETASAQRETGSQSHA